MVWFLIAVQWGPAGVELQGACEGWKSGRWSAVFIMILKIRIGSRCIAGHELQGLYSVSAMNHHPFGFDQRGQLSPLFLRTDSYYFLSLC